MKTADHEVWPYDEQGRLIGEDVWEYGKTVCEIIPLDPADVLTVEHSAKLLDLLIKPLPETQSVPRVTPALRVSSLR